MSHEPAINSMNILSDGIVEFIHSGYQRVDDVNKVHAKITELTDTYHQKGKKLLILIDISDVTGYDRGARQASRKPLDVNFDALAVYGNNPSLRLFINWLIRLTGNRHRVQLFSTREEAMHWLREPH